MIKIHVAKNVQQLNQAVEQFDTITGGAFQGVSDIGTLEKVSYSLLMKSRSNLPAYRAMASIVKTFRQNLPTTQFINVPVIEPGDLK